MKRGAACIFFLVSGAAWADGWTIQWGAARVPLSPWLSASIATLLAFAGIAILRRRAARGLLLLAVAAVAGGLALLPDQNLLAKGTGWPITSDNGAFHFACSSVNDPNQYQYLQNDSSRPVTLIVTPDNTWTLTPPDNAILQALYAQAGDCYSGLQLQPGRICTFGAMCPG